MFPSTQGLLKPKRHTEWSDLKKKHAAAIKAKAIKFDEKLGAALDKLSEHEAKLAKAEAAGTLTVPDWKAHLALYTPVDSLVTAYRAKIKGLGGKPESELGGALTNLANDHKAWKGAWDQLQKARPKLDELQAAAAALRKPMDNLKTRTPAAITEITKLVSQNKKVVPDLNTLAGKATAEVQNFGQSALFELKLLVNKLSAAREAVALIEKASSRAASDAALAKLKDKAAGLNSLTISPLADAVKGIMNPNLTMGKSIQLNGVKAYGGDFQTAHERFQTALRALN